MQLTVYGPLRSATGEKTVQVDADGETVRDILDALIVAYPRAEPHLTDEAGALRPSVRVVVDGERVDLDDVVGDDESMQVFPAMRGG